MSAVVRRGTCGALFIVTAAAGCCLSGAPSGGTVLPPPLVLAPAPIAVPEELPMVGLEGTDARGEPLRSAEMLGFQALLRARRFDDLCTYVTTLEDDFESDVTHESWPIQALEAFDAPYADAAALHDAWVAATPECWAAYAARGHYLSAMGFAERGDAWAADTAPEALDAMAEYFVRAADDFDRSLAMRPRQVAAPIALLDIASALGDRASVRAIYAEAIGSCPDCMELRFAYLRNVRPRWGGEPVEIEATLAAVDARRRRGLEVFRAYADYDRCYELRSARLYDEALAACDSALAAEPYWRYFVERGSVRRARSELIEALADLDRALEVRPRASGAMIERVAVLADLERNAEAAEQLQLVVHIAPEEVRLMRRGSALASWIIAERESARASGRTAGAEHFDAILYDVLLPEDPRRPVR